MFHIRPREAPDGFVVGCLFDFAFYLQKMSATLRSKRRTTKKSLCFNNWFLSISPSDPSRWRKVIIFILSFFS